MNNKIKNNRENYISRSSLTYSNNKASEDELSNEKCIEPKNTESKRYSEAVIEDDWYINFNTDNQASNS